jgi:tRNA modification GTPase
MIDWQDTIVGLATATGNGCRAILRVAGPAAHRIVAASLYDVDKQPWMKPLRRTVRFQIRDWRRSVEAVLLAWPEGRSATGQPMTELHLPAGSALSNAIQEQLIADGARLARPGEFTLRMFLAGKLDLAQAEGVLGLVEAVDARQLAFAIDRRTGGLSRRIAGLRSSLLDFLADVEASLDFVEEDIQFVDRTGAMKQLDAAINEVQTLRQDQGKRSLSSGRPTVVLLGPPNAGKSSLFNALVGESAAIISPISGTTRDVLSGTAIFDGKEIDLIDTAGIDEAAEADAAGIQGQAADLRHRSRQSANLLIQCLPVGEPVREEWKASANVLLVRTQADRNPAFTDPAADCCTSVIGEPGIADLRRMIAARLHLQTGDAPFGVAERCIEGLNRAAARLEETRRDFFDGGGLELLAAGLRLSLDDLGELVGAVYTDDLLDRIFSRFCIGK